MTEIPGKLFLVPHSPYQRTVTLVEGGKEDAQPVDLDRLRRDWGMRVTVDDTLPCDVEPENGGNVA